MFKLNFGFDEFTEEMVKTEKVPSRVVLHSVENQENSYLKNISEKQLPV